MRIELTKINTAVEREIEERRNAAPDYYRDSDDIGENEGGTGAAGGAEPVTGEALEARLREPVTISVESIRCFYPRKNSRPGTRLTFTDGGGFVVVEDYATVKARIEEAETVARRAFN